MDDTTAIWMSLAEKGKAYDFVDDALWDQLLSEAREEGVKLERRVLTNVDAIYLRRTYRNA